MSRNTMISSDEADEKGLRLGREQGEALERTLRHMIDDVAEGGEEKLSGEYLVALAFEEAEGMYERRGEDLEWVEPSDENLHIEIAVRDPADGRFIPGLSVTVCVLDADGTEVGTHEHPLLWHPYLYHYGRNWKLPDRQPFTIRAKIEAPRFPRHDKKNGRRFLKGTEVEFTGIRVELGAE